MRKAKTFNILSIDGGHGERLGILLDRLENLVCEQTSHASVIDHADLIAGNSHGALTALYLAKYKTAAEGLSKLRSFWETYTKDMWTPPDRFLGGLWGFTALHPLDKFRDYLIEEFGAHTMLGDLPGKVAVTSLQLDNGLQEPYREWQPRLFHNLKGSHYLDELVVDVALRSSALPLVHPIFQSITGQGPGYVDGGVFANNPAMVVLAKALDYAHMTGIRILSVGTDREIAGGTHFLTPELHDGAAPWGYQRWLLDPAKPLLLLEVFLHGTKQGATLQCQTILKERFMRVDPRFVNGELVDNPPTVEAFDAALSWIQQSGWLPSTAQAADAPAETQEAEATPAPDAEAEAEAAEPAKAPASKRRTASSKGTTRKQSKPKTT